MSGDEAAPADGPDREADVIHAAGGFRGLAERLTETVAEAARLARMIDDHWPDARGHELSERVGMVAREIDRASSTAGELAQAIADRLALLAADHQRAPDSRTPGEPGVRLPGLEGSRTSDDRGVTLPRLPEP